MQGLDDAAIKKLNVIANDIRITLTEALTLAKSGHLGGSLGMADVFTALYFWVARHDPKNPHWEDRDRILLSNGHICPVQYAAMAHAGYFPIEEMKTLRKLGSRLQGHPERDKLPGLETTSGPLGSGLSQACGMALAAKMDDKAWRVYVCTSDGEHDEGNTWEAAMFASAHRLSNVTQIIDRNCIQIDGNTEDVMPLEPFADKYRAFGWHVIEIDGNSIPHIIAALEEAKTIHEKPTIIVAHTTLGKGIPEIENDYRWHGNPPGKGPSDKVPAAEQHDVFIKELKNVGEHVLAGRKI